MWPLPLSLSRPPLLLHQSINQSTNQSINQSINQASYLRGGDAHHAPRDALAGVTSGEGVLVSAAAQVVSVGLDHDAAADDGVGADQLHVAVLDIHVRYSVLVRVDVAQVSHHALLVVGGAVVAAEGVEDGAAGGEALAEVAKDVDVDTVLALQIDKIR